MIGVVCCFQNMSSLENDYENDYKRDYNLPIEFKEKSVTQQIANSIGRFLMLMAGIVHASQ